MARMTRMTAEDYRRLSAPFRMPGRSKALRLANTVLTRLYYVAYPLLLLWLWRTGDGRALRALLVPAVSFVLLSVFRHAVNAPRPYQVLEIEPLIHKNTQGYSFPSRHVFSCFVIAMTFLWIVPPVGAILLLGGVTLALCRVVGGVHWPRDVAVGALVGVLSGAAYWLLPGQGG